MSARPAAADPLAARAAEICDRQRQRLFSQTDRLFARLMVFQWFGAVAAALWITPRTWVGSSSSPHLHLGLAVVLGGLIALPPVVLVWLRPGRPITRHTIGVCQALTSALLIHVTGGRIETHFHVFGSLAFLAFYRDWRVLVSASAVVATDHFLRGTFWPQSVYGVLAASPWRWLEHAGWVLFEDAFLIHSCLKGQREMRQIARHQAEMEETNRRIEDQVRQRTQELADSQLQLFHAAKLESVGRLAAGVAHEVKNPLAITLLGLNYLEEQEGGPRDEGVGSVVATMKDAIRRADSVIRGLLDFASPREIDMQPHGVNEVVEQSLLLVRGDLLHAHIEPTLELAEDLPLVRLDTQKIQQVLVNVCVNACHAMPEGGSLRLRSRATAGSVVVEVADTGTGIPSDKLDKVFEPFYTTKPPGQGTGLGLSVSKKIMELHDATISFSNRPEGGVQVTLRFPALTPEVAHAR